MEAEKNDEHKNGRACGEHFALRALLSGPGAAA
jgi:hypothetical protein